MQGIHRQIHTSPFFYKASRVPHQLRVFLLHTIRCAPCWVGRGSEYAQLAYHEFDKKHAEIDQRQSDETNKRMYAEPGKTDCPVSSLKHYISHLHPDQDAFFQRPSQTTHGRWYDNVPVGKCSLGSFMKKRCRSCCCL